MIINKIKTFLLLSILSVILLSLGSIIGGKEGLFFALLLSVAMNFFAYFYSDKIVLSLHKAKELDKNNFAIVYQITHDLTTKMQIPVPKLWLIETKMANAFATGRNSKNASVAVTTGILELLSERELRAVLSHELSHIKNNDILISSVAATITSAIGYLINMMHYTSIFRTNNERKKENPIGTIFLILLMPIVITLVQLAISRSREYLADESGAHYCQDPIALASALEKLHLHTKHLNLEKNVINATTASLFIVNPFNKINWASLFSTHPSIYKRIQRLREIYENKFKIIN